MSCYHINHNQLKLLKLWNPMSKHRWTRLNYRSSKINDDQWIINSRNKVPACFQRASSIMRLIGLCRNGVGIDAQRKMQILWDLCGGSDNRTCVKPPLDPRRIGWHTRVIPMAINGGSSRRFMIAETLGTYIPSNDRCRACVVCIENGSRRSWLTL